LAVADNSSLYVTGWTWSTNFPVKKAIQPSNNGAGMDAFITKLRPGNTGPDQLHFSTFLGGTGNDQANGIAIDWPGIYVVGKTSSTDFPTKKAFQPANAGGIADAFLVKLWDVVPQPSVNLMLLSD
jgi:hypothetical protein